MAKLRVANFSISLDGFGAGPAQSLENPLGSAQLHAWASPTRTLRRTVFGADGGTTGLDDDFVARGFENVGAWILGRNMFGPLRGPWPDESWRGWWGAEPPCHVPVFVLTHHARVSLAMAGGTTFHFVTGGIHEALERAREAAGTERRPPMPRTIRIHRVLEAPFERVCRAFLDPDAMVKWLPPNGFTGTARAVDARVGGSLRTSFTHISTGSSLSFGGTHLPGTMVVAADLRRVSRGTGLTITREGVPDVVAPGPLPRLAGVARPPRQARLGGSSRGDVRAARTQVRPAPEPILAKGRGGTLPAWAPSV